MRASSRRPAPHTAPYGRGAVQGEEGWLLSTAARQQASRLAQGAVPLNTDCAPWARRGVRKHAGCSGFYRRGTMGATARRLGRFPCQLAGTSRPMACGPPRGGTRWKAAYLRSYHRSATVLAVRWSEVVSHQLASIDRHSAKGLMASNQNPACFQNRLDFFVTKQPKPCRSLSPHAISAPLPPKRRRSRAAIGSGGKKARSF